MHKRSRPISDKIEDALTKIGNLEPSLKETLRAELFGLPVIANSVVKSKKYIIDRLHIPEMGRTTLPYWLARGWPEPQARYKQTQASGLNRPRLSPYSREFWMQKINSKTGINYTESEADWMRNSKRPIRKEYWMTKGHNEAEAEKLAAETKKTNNQRGSEKSQLLSNDIRRSHSSTSMDYWILRGHSPEEANALVSKRQATFSLETCIAKYGPEEGLNRWKERQKKWHKSFKKQNYSKISQELFWMIVDKLPSTEGIYFAQLNKEKAIDDSGCNHELRLTLDSTIMPDFIDTNTKRVIEFDGAYWHGSVGRGNKQRDKDRDDMYKKYGYTVKRVAEQAFKSNKETVVNECLTFLTQ